jgi:LmbE family N-acetylglucosaminyl deacetylase
VTQYVKDHNIKAVFTFDKCGVSQHANHIAINQAIIHFIVKEKSETSIKLYQL